ncbi:MAG: hypothetical protein Q8P61_05490 [Candidatus Nanopelagicales bacterium]|nr:hypothetical protein [Candidatus Nanopelagicales bacterium]
MTRAAILPAGPDPFLLAYWFRNFARVWSSEVDELHVLVCGQADPTAQEYIVDRALAVSNPGLSVNIRFLKQRLDHGQALGLLMDRVTADHVVFLEDDAYVRRTGEIAARFHRLENGVDVIGGPRGNASMEIIAAAETRFGEVWTASSGESGHALWPCFLFARRDVLEATDRHYGARNWTTGEMVGGLNLTARSPLSADTFGSATYQLRANKARIEVESQYRITNTNQMREWVTDAPWFHVGSLSSGYGNVLGDDAGSLSTNEYEGADWARRLSWWERFARTADGLPDHLAHYRAEIASYVERARIGRSDIDGWTQAYQGWITWQETP